MPEAEKKPRKRRESAGSVHVSFVTKAGAKGSFRCSSVSQQADSWVFRLLGRGDRITIRRLYTHELASFEMTGPIGLVESAQVPYQSAPWFVPVGTANPAPSPPWVVSSEGTGPVIHNPRAIRPTIQQVQEEQKLRAKMVGSVPFSEVADEGGNVGVYPAGFMPT